MPEKYFRPNIHIFFQDIRFLLGGFKLKDKAKTKDLTNPLNRQ